MKKPNKKQNVNFVGVSLEKMVWKIIKKLKNAKKNNNKLNKNHKNKNKIIIILILII